MASIKCTHGGTRHTHDSIEAVRACQQSAAPVVTSQPVSAARVGQLVGAGASSNRFAGIGQPVDEPATANQISFLERLVQERKLPQDGSIDGLANLASLTKAAASRAIEALQAQPRRDEDKVARDASTTDEPTEFGMYRQARTGDLFRVYPAREGGHLLSKRLILSERPDGEATFMYAGAAKRNVKASEKMTLEEAKAFGQQFGVCCMCAAILTDPESVAAGIGPICAGKV